MITEADILSEVVGPDEPDLSPECARAILQLKFRPRAVDRLNELAEKNRRGALSDTEQAELGRYLRVGNFLNLIQAKAHKSLAESS